MKITASDYVNLIRAKVDILKLKANDYEWQCHTPKEVKQQLEEALEKINALITCSEIRVDPHGHIIEE